MYRTTDGETVQEYRLNGVGYSSLADLEAALDTPSVDRAHSMRQ